MQSAVRTSGTDIGRYSGNNLLLYRLLISSANSVSIKHRCDIEFVPRNSKRLLRNPWISTDAGYFVTRHLTK